VVSVGGGANIPAVTTMLSGNLGVPVVTTPRTQLTAAIGGALRASRGPDDASATALTPAASMMSTPSAPIGPAVREAEMAEARLMPALAWSEAGDDSRAVPVGTGEPARAGGPGYTSARPALNFVHTAQPRPKVAEAKPTVIPWYRLPAVIVIGTAVAVLLVGMAVAIGLSSDNTPATTPVPGVGTPPASSAPPSPPPANGGSPQPAPAPQPTDAPGPSAAYSPAAPAPVMPHIPAIPPIPHIPGIGQIIPGLPRG
jgi:hypothetical protein